MYSSVTSQSMVMTSGGGASCATSAEVRPKLLVVDDLPAIRDVIATGLRYSGFDACCASGGDEARALVAIDPPALVITDLNMPSGDGWGLIDFCRAHYPQLPVLIVSGLPPGTHPEIESFADGYLAKPFDFRELLAEVARLVPAGTGLWKVG